MVRHPLQVAGVQLGAVVEPPELSPLLEVARPDPVPAGGVRPAQHPDQPAQVPAPHHLRQVSAPAQALVLRLRPGQLLPADQVVPAPDPEVLGRHRRGPAVRHGAGVVGAGGALLPAVLVEQALVAAVVGVPLRVVRVAGAGEALSCRGGGCF